MKKYIYIRIFPIYKQKFMYTHIYKQLFFIIWKKKKFKVYNNNNKKTKIYKKYIQIKKETKKKEKLICISLYIYFYLF